MPLPGHQDNLHTKTQIELPVQEERYITVNQKFWLAHFAAFLWMTFSIFLSIPWVNDLGSIVGKPLALLIIAGIGYIPGYICFFTAASLLMDRQPKFKNLDPSDTVTIIITCRNEEGAIADTLRYIKTQDYRGRITIIVVDNNSSDQTTEAAINAGRILNLDVKVLFEAIPGKYNALNKALDYVETDFVITLDADTLLHKSAIRYIMARFKSAPDDICAVAGSVLVRNSRQNFLARLQEWDYFLGIASIKRMQGLYQGTLVAQGAFSAYKTEAIKLVGGWPNAIGEDIVLTWNFLKKNMRVYSEPLAVAFTEVPNSLTHLARQRSRWARGMIEALKVIRPWQHPIKYVKYLTGINLIMPYLDIVYTLCWMPGLVLAFFGLYWIVGPTTLLILPIALYKTIYYIAIKKKYLKV